MALWAGRLDAGLPPGCLPLLPPTHGGGREGVGCAGPRPSAADGAHADGGAGQRDRGSTTTWTNIHSFADIHFDTLAADGNAASDHARACGQPVRTAHSATGTCWANAHGSADVPAAGENNLSPGRWRTRPVGPLSYPSTSPGRGCGGGHPSAPGPPAADGRSALGNLAPNAKCGPYPGCPLSRGTPSPRLYLRQALHGNDPLQ